MKCVHCLKSLTEKTRDHVFPSSWYPDDTPSDVQRWTVPSCSHCNGKFGRLEKELFVRLALCISPEKAQASGITKRAFRSLGVGVDGLSPREKAHRTALLKKIFTRKSGSKPLNEVPLLPGLGYHEGFPADQQIKITVSDELLKRVSEKVLRGCEYKLNNEAYIEQPYKLKIIFAHDQGLEDVTRLFESLKAETLGPGFEVRRGQSPPEKGVYLVLYRVIIWGTLKVYATIEREGDFGRHA